MTTMKVMKEPQPLWTRLLALSGFLLMMGAALAFPRVDDPEARAGAQAAANVRMSGKPNSAEIAWLFRSYAKVTPGPQRFLMTGPTLREKPLG